MAHISGYGGSMTFTAGEIEGTGTPKVVAAIESWTVNSTSETFAAFAKKEDWETGFQGAAEWDATVVCLVQDDATTGLLPELYSSPTLNTVIFLLNATRTLESGTIAAGTSPILANVSTSNPIDGPVKVTYTIIGNGPLDAGYS